jgi:hypothetical protein
MRPLMIVVAVVTGGVCLPIVGRAAQPSDMQLVSGTCDPSRQHPRH